MCMEILERSELFLAQYDELKNRRRVYKCMSWARSGIKAGYTPPLRINNRIYSLGDTMFMSPGPTRNENETAHGVYTFFELKDARRYADGMSIQFILLCEVDPDDLLHIAYTNSAWIRVLGATYSKVKLLRELNRDYGSYYSKTSADALPIRETGSNQGAESTPSGD